MISLGNPVDLRLNFHSTPSSCIADFKAKPWIKKALSLIVSFGHLFKYVIDWNLMQIRGMNQRMSRYAQISPEDLPKQRLIVCLHGLNSKPMQFGKIVEEISCRESKDNQSTFYIPNILQKGNASLDDVTAPILKEIAKWTTSGENKELVLIGISNGGRVAKAIEAELINSDQSGKIKKLRFISIVGACKGSSLVTLAHKLHLSFIVSWMSSKIIADEMQTTSARNKRLQLDWERARENREIERDDTFIASPHDWQVPNYNSSLMESPNARARYVIVPGHGHNSIVSAVAKSIAEIIS